MAFDLHAPVCRAVALTVALQRDGAPVHRRVLRFPTCTSRRVARGPSRGSLRLDGDGFTSSPSVARLIISAVPACGSIYRRVVMPVANASARNANTSGPYVTPPKYPKL